MKVSKKTEKKLVCNPGQPGREFTREWEEVTVCDGKTHTVIATPPFANSYIVGVCDGLCGGWRPVGFDELPAEGKEIMSKPIYRRLRQGDEVDKLARKEFARDQFQYLLELGFSKGKAARIMKAAGPGQVRAAVAWAYDAIKCVDGNVDALDVVLCGEGGTKRFGWARMTSALEALDLPVPTAYNSTSFFGTLAGAKEALLAGLPAKEK